MQAGVLYAIIHMHECLSFWLYYFAENGPDISELIEPLPASSRPVVPPCLLDLIQGDR